MKQTFLMKIGRSRGFWSRAARGLAVAAALLPQPGAFGLAILDSGHPSALANEAFITTADQASLKSISYEKHQVRIRLDKPEVPYRVFSLSNPPRVVVELPRVIHGPKPYEAAVRDDVLKRIRSSQFKTSPELITRIVLDLPRMVPYRAVREGDSVVLHFDGGKNLESRLQGQAEEVVKASAVSMERVDGSKSAPKDLLASLPRNPITIDFDDADIRDVIRVLSEMSGINMIYGTDLRGFLTIHLDQAPFDEVFNTVMTMQGLVAQQIGNNILRILTPEALNTDRARSVTLYRTFLLNYGRASEISGHLAAVRVSPNARVTIDERNNALVVTDTPEGLAAAERLIAELDRKPAQVLIETRIVQITLGKSLNLGIQWELSSHPGDSTAQKRKIIGLRNVVTGTESEDGQVGFVGQRNNSSTGELEDIVTSAAGPGSRGTGVNLAGPTSAGITFGYINSTEVLTATLGALEEEGQTKTLTNPKIITTNNQAARIQIGSRVPFLQTTVTGTGVATQSTVFADVGFIINVTPTINVDNRIRLRVRPEASTLADLTDAGPTIDTTTAETEVILKDGETIVIGGLIREDAIETASKVPLLGDLPVLGVFFRSTVNSKSRQELLIFISARIVPD